MFILKQINTLFDKEYIKQCKIIKKITNKTNKYNKPSIYMNNNNKYVCKGYYNNMLKPIKECRHCSFFDLNNDNNNTK